MRRANKYGARKASGSSGRLYDSTAERDRAEELRLLEQAGEISELREQTRVPLVAGIWLRTDFDYLEAGRLVHEDVKGVITRSAALKFKLWRQFGPAPLRIVKRANRRGRFVVTKEILPKAQEVGRE